MNIIRKIFKKKKNPDEAGFDLFHLCVLSTKEQLPEYQKFLAELELGTELGKNENDKELLVINMWSVTKALSGWKYDEVIRCMHDHYFTCYQQIGRQAEHKWLLSRYEQYEKYYDHEKGQHLVLALYILANIYNNGELDKRFLNPFVGIKIISLFIDVMVIAQNYVTDHNIKNPQNEQPH
jgi:hypothetical protein